MITLKIHGNIFIVTCGDRQQIFDTLADAFRCIEMLKPKNK